MPPNNSRHLLPMTSVLFTTTNNDPSSRSNPPHHLANPTLANLKDALDTTVTALPQPPTTTSDDTKRMNDGFWKRIVARIKSVLGFEREEKEGKWEDKEMCIGAPTGFKHVETAGPRPLRRSVPIVREESDWEDVE